MSNNVATQHGDRTAHTVKRSVSLDARVAAEVDDLAGRGHFSGYVEKAVRRQLQRDALTALLDEMERYNGPSDPEDVARAVAELRG